MAGDGSTRGVMEGNTPGGSVHMEPRKPEHRRREAAEPLGRAAVRECTPVPSAPSTALPSERERTTPPARPPHTLTVAATASTPVRTCVRAFCMASRQRAGATTVTAVATARAAELPTVAVGGASTWQLAPVVGVAVVAGERGADVLTVASHVAISFVLPYSVVTLLCIAIDVLPGSGGGGWLRAGWATAAIAVAGSVWLDVDGLQSLMWGQGAAAAAAVVAWAGGRLNTTTHVVPGGASAVALIT